MIFKLRKTNIATLLFFGLAFVSACVSAPHSYLQYGDEYREIDLDKILAGQPLRFLVIQSDAFSGDRRPRLV